MRVSHKRAMPPWNLLTEITNMMQYNILITSAGKRVVLTRAFKETLVKYYPEAKVYTTDINPEMAPAGYVSDECIQVPRCTVDN